MSPPVSSPAVNRLPIYRNRNHLWDELPPEMTYSTFPAPGAEEVGHVVSRYRLQRSYEGVWGARHLSPDPRESGHYSTHALINCATRNLYGLSWEAIIPRDDDMAEMTEAPTVPEVSTKEAV